MDVENKYGILEIQKELLKLIKIFDSFCIENKISYSLNDGTLLGAVRHNGFIPWDDDLDIIMDRENYSKLAHSDLKDYGIVLKRELWIDKVYLKDSNDKADTSTYHPFLDILIFDVAPKGRISRKIKKLLIGFVQGMIKGKPDYSRFPMKYKVFSFITYCTGRLFPAKFKNYLYHEISQKFGSQSSPYASSYNEPFNDIGILHKADALSRIVRHQFEDTDLPIMEDYHDYLTDLYGDYMTPPKEEDRIPLHSNI